MRPENLRPGAAGRRPALRVAASLRWTLLATIILFVLYADPAAAQDARKYWIFFDEKPAWEADGERLLTARARERRALRGTETGSWSDTPVSTSYLDRLQEIGVEPVVVSRWLNAVSADLAAEARDRVRQLPFVSDVRPVGRVIPAATDAQPFWDTSDRDRTFVLDYGTAWMQLALINAVAPVEAGINGTGVRLGFLDTPYGDFEHPSLRHLVQSGRLIAERNFVDRPDMSTHGMSVASVAVGFDEGRLIGPGYGAEVLAATTEYVPTETNEEEDFFVAGMEWLEEMGVDVVNISLGYTTFDEGERSYTQADLDGRTGVTTLAVDRAAALGVVVVVSAGNDALTKDGRPCFSPDDCWYYVGTPADAHHAITVGGIRHDSTRAIFSSFGPTADGRIKPDVAAPAWPVFVARPGGYGNSSGTSFAAPLVAGVVTQMLQVNPELTPSEVREILRQTASQADSPDTALGWGVINAAEAVQTALALTGMERRPDAASSVRVFPNPATERVFIHISASSAAGTRLAVYDVLGRQVVAPHDEMVRIGLNTVSLSTRNLQPGVYFFTVSGVDTAASGKFIVIR